MTTLTKVRGGLGLTAQERQLLSAFRSMSTDARDDFVLVSEALAHRFSAEAPRLTLAHSGAAGAQP
jgi:hypothetical protein